MKLPEAATGVIEDTVEDDFHVFGVSRIDEFSQSLVATQQRIDVEVVERVVAMICS